MAEVSTSRAPDRELLRVAFEASPIGIAVESLDGQPLLINPAFCRFLGFTEEELCSKHCVDFSPPEDAAKDWALFQQLKAGSIDHYQLEKRYFRKDGSLVWGRLSVSLYKSHPSPLVIALVEDITGKKNVEEALRSSEERLRLAAQIGKMYAYSWDVLTDEVVRSPEYVNVLGVSAQHRFTRRQLLENLHPEDRASWIASTEKLTPENPTCNINYRVLRPDGSEVWVEKNARAFFDTDGRMLRVVGMVANVTERKLAEQRLQEYERAVEGSEEMIVVVDREYRYVIANRQFLKMRNMTMDQVVGHSVRELLTRPELFEEIIQPKLNECFQGKVVRYEMKYPYPQVGERDLLISYFPIERDGIVDRATCILHDITDLKRAEQSLTDMSRKLLEAQEQERARIGRELHDDINQRLALLAIDLQQLESDPSKAQTLTRKIREQLDDISSDVQALSHELHSSKLHYLGVLAGIRSWANDFAERQRLEIDFSSDVSGPIPYDIGLSLFRVLQEAVHNALKHSGVKRVEIQIRQGDSSIHLTIRDSGKGFDVQPAMHGRGLGLTSMKERVRLINGTISIESKPMQGTTIHVRVPLRLDHDSEELAG